MFLLELFHFWIESITAKISKQDKVFRLSEEIVLVNALKNLNHFLALFFLLMQQNAFIEDLIRHILLTINNIYSIEECGYW